MTVHVYSLIRRIKPQWIEPIQKGAERHGWRTSFVDGMGARVNPGDILFTWNRHVDQDQIARKFESEGGKVFCLENPYLKMPEGSNYVSVGLGFHNNVNYSPKCRDNGERFASFNKEIKPWRTEGGHILIPTQSKQFNQKGLGWRDYAAPVGCDGTMIDKVKKVTKRKVLFRIHPNSQDLKAIRTQHGKQFSVSNCSYERRPIEDDLHKAWATVLWTSNAATDSLLAGVPVFVLGPGVFLKDACNVGLSNIEQPTLPDTRPSLFNRMAWSQYSKEEIASGFMFDCLLSD